MLYSIAYWPRSLISFIWPYLKPDGSALSKTWVVVVALTDRMLALSSRSKVQCVQIVLETQLGTEAVCEN